MMLVDHHCHLDFPQLAPDREGLLARARAAGVGVMVTISTRIRKLPELLAIAERTTTSTARSARIRTTRTRSSTFRSRRSCACRSTRRSWRSARRGSTTTTSTRRPRRRPKASAATSRPRARRACRSRSTRARPTTTPRASSRRSTPRVAFPAILHCYTGGPDLALRALALGLYVSFTGVVTFKKSDALRDIANSVPLDRLLVETDAPFLAPEPYRGKTNEPAYVVHTAAALAKARGISADELAAATTENFFRLFGKVPRPAARGRPGAPPPHELPRDDPRLRLLGRRAAHRQHAGAPAIPPTRGTGAGAAACWSSGSGASATRRCWSTPRPTCASSS